jgi:hypothetical protein
MKKIIALVSLVALTIMIPQRSLAAGGIYASGGGTKTVGETFTITVAASGAAFDTIDGKISVSGPVSISSFTPGSAAAWMSQPSNGGSFSGAVVLGKTVTSFTVATIKLKATGVGNGAVSVSGVLLQSSGSNVGTGAGSASFTIQKAPDLPGAVKVSSPSHADQATAYEATTIELAWTKDSGVDGFSYLLDQAEGTTPATKITDANTSAAYPNNAVGTYYFHIRAHKPDGWGGTTHFRINIKEPDAKINSSLAKPSDIKIEKDSSFVNNIKEGTVTGIVITGKTEPGFTANITITPAPTMPEGRTLTAAADSSGNWRLLIDFPIAVGFHKLTVQGQKEKVLTPISDEITFEISQAKGGSINILTDNDINVPVVKAENTKESFKINKEMLLYGLILLILIIITTVSIIFYKKRLRNNKILRAISKK